MSDPLEDLPPEIGWFVKSRGGSPQLANMLQKLVEYYGACQITYVKHGDAVIAAKVEFV